MNRLLKFLRIFELLIFFIKFQNCIVTPEYKKYVEYNIEYINMVKEKEKRRKN